MDKGPNPPNLRSRQITLQTGVVYDTVPPFKKFGDVLTQVKSEYNPVSSIFTNTLAHAIRLKWS